MCEPSVALIRGQSSSGTGFLVRPGILATNAHVVDSEFTADLQVHFPSATPGKRGPLTARLLFLDRRRDLALLGIESDLPALGLETSRQYRKGQEITVIGNPGVGPLTLENAVSRGILSTKTVIEDLDYFQMDVAINPGNSGGPAITSTGRVIGVVTSKATRKEGIAFAIPVEDLRKAMRLLDNDSGAGSTKPVKTEREEAEVALKREQEVKRERAAEQERLDQAKKAERRIQLAKSASAVESWRKLRKLEYAKAGIPMPARLNESFPPDYAMLTLMDIHHQYASRLLTAEAAVAIKKRLRKPVTARWLVYLAEKTMADYAVPRSGPSSIILSDPLPGNPESPEKEELVLLSAAWSEFRELLAEANELPKEWDK
jgi:hypothetical protein